MTKKSACIMLLKLQKGMCGFETNDGVDDCDFACCGNSGSNGTLHACCNTGCANTNSDRRNWCQYLRLDNFPGKQPCVFRLLSGEIVCKIAEKKEF